MRSTVVLLRAPYRPNTSNFSSPVSAISVSLWTHRPLLGHPGSFKSVHDLKCMRIQTGPWFYVSSEGRWQGLNLELNLPGRALYQLSYIPAVVSYTFIFKLNDI